jgi:hypothetical protein
MPRSAHYGSEAEMKSRRLNRIALAGAATLILIGCGNVYLDGQSDSGTSDKDAGRGTSPDAADERSPSKDAGLPPLPDSSPPDAEIPDSPATDTDGQDTGGPPPPDAESDTAPPFDVDVPDSAPTWDGGSPVAVATGQAPTSLVLDDTNVYWQNSSADPAIEYCPLAGCPGGTPTILVGAENQGYNSFTVSQSIAYFFEGPGISLYQVPISGGTATMTTSPGYGGPPLFSNSTTLFMSQLYDLYTCPVGSPCPMPPPTLYSVPPMGTVTLIGLSSTEAYFVSTPPDSLFVGAIQAIPLAGGTPRTVSTSFLFDIYNLMYLGPAAITADYVYFSSSASTPSVPDGAAIYQVPIAGGDPVVYAIDEYPYGLAADGTNLYWTNSVATTGSVRACALGAECSAPVTVAAGQDNPQPIVVNASTVYWGTASAINSATKPM